MGRPRGVEPLMRGMTELSIIYCKNSSEEMQLTTIKHTRTSIRPILYFYFHNRLVYTFFKRQTGIAILLIAELIIS